MAMHRIRLRGPWEVSWSGVGPSDQAAKADAGVQLQTRRVTMPAGWPSGPWHQQAERVELRRSFNTPTGLDLATRVELVIVSSHPIGSLRLNDHVLELESTDAQIRTFPAHPLPRAETLATRDRRWHVGPLLRERETNLLFAALVIDAALPIEQPIWETWLEIFDESEV